MTLEAGHFAAFSLALIAAWLSPGPALMLALRTTLASGRRAGILTGLGLGMMATLWTGAALFGLQVVFELFPLAYWSVKLLGAAYLAWLAFTMWRDATRPLSARPALSDGHAIRTGFLLNLLNPKSVLFAAAVLVLVFPPDLTLVDKVAVMANHFLLEVSLYAALASFVALPTFARRYMNMKPTFDRLAGTVMGLLALRLVLDRAR